MWWHYMLVMSLQAAFLGEKSVEEDVDFCCLSMD